MAGMDTSPSWISLHNGRLLLTLHIQPGASRTALAGLHGEALKIRLAAPPVDGKANAALLRFVAETLKHPPRQINHVSGQSSRQKRVAVEGWADSLAAACALLLPPD